MPIEWDRAKPAIYNLYVVQRRSLRDVRQSLYKNHGFNASIRSYRGKLKEWGFIRRQDIGERLSQVQHAIQSDTTQTSSTDRAMSDMAFQPLSFLSSSNDANTWLPATSDYGLTTGQIEQLPPNFGTVSPSSNAFADASSLRQDFSSSMNLDISPQTSVSIDRLDESGRTLLHHAVLRRSLEDVEKQLVLGSNPNVPDHEEQYPLHLASEKGWQDIIRLLLKRGANVKVRNKLGQTPLHLAVKFPKVVKLLLAAHPEVSGLDESRNSPLHLAISMASLDDLPKNTTIEQLIHAGADLNIQNSQHKTPFELILVHSRGKFQSQYIILFLENELDISIPTSTGKLPFELFVENALERLTQLDSRTDPGKRNPDIKMFIAKGAHVNMNLASGNSLIGSVAKNLAFIRYDCELVKLLCDVVAVNTPDTKGDYPLHHILHVHTNGWTRAEECLEILLRRGARINQKNEAGETALTIIISSIREYWHHDIRRITVDFLLSHGADPMIPNSKGEFPICIAAGITGKELRDHIVKVLLDGIWSKNSKDLEDPHGLSGFDSTEMPSSSWWATVLKLLNNTAWTDPNDLKNGSGHLPSNEAEYILDSILSYAARKYLESSKSGYEHLIETKGIGDEETRYHSSQIVRILRDCDEHKINIDESWYRYVLKFFP